MFKITNDEALKLLVDRVESWTKDPEVVRLYKKMYENYLESGVFEENESSVMEIVDNDYVNYCSVVSRTDLGKDAKKIVKLYKDGERDISCEGLEYSYIEAVNNRENPTLFLMRC